MTIIKILQFIASFSLLVLIHELGHFAFARMFGIRVEKFYLFFDPWFSLFKFKYKGTEYGIGWVPFGGYVKIAGMIDESMDTEAMKQPAKPDEFRSKPAWQRLLVMTGGVLMNVVLALGIYIGMSCAWGEAYYAPQDVKYGYVFNDLGHEVGFRDGDVLLGVNGNENYENTGALITALILDDARWVDVRRGDSLVSVELDPAYMPAIRNSAGFMTFRTPFVVAEPQPGGGALKAGVAAGDTLVAVDGMATRYFNEATAAFDTLRGSTAALTFARDSSGIRVERTMQVAVSGEGKIGVSLTPLEEIVPPRTQTYSFFAAIPAGFKRTGEELSSYWKQIKMIFNPKTEAYKSLGGVISIGNIFPDFWSWYNFWKITAFLSIVLAVMNILPIPALDGGHVLFLLYEVVTRRKPSDKFMEFAQLLGMVLVFGLILYATGNDIYRFFIK